MPRYCPKCECEILPYLKTGELKVTQEIKSSIMQSKMVAENISLTSYQLFFCIYCKIVYYVKHEEFPFINLNDAIAEKQRKEVKGKGTGNEIIIKKGGKSGNKGDKDKN